MSDAVEETIFSFSHETPEPPERRSQPRHLTILRVGTLIVDERRELCLIRNISAGGVMAHVYSTMTPGEHVSVEIKSSQPIPGTVTWIQDSNVGISFDSLIDVEEMLANQSLLENGWRPRPPRIEVDRLATLRVGARVYGVSTRDISQGGVKIEADEAFQEGEEVVLTLDKFRPVHGVVRWTKGTMCGIAFNQVIPFHDLMGWLRQKD